jgi:hypothetical protein
MAGFFKPYDVLVYEKKGDKTTRFVVSFATIKECREWVETAMKEHPGWDIKAW